MGTVILSVRVADYRERPDGSWSHWTKEMTTEFLPRKGDEVQIVDDIDRTVKYPYWEEDGRVSVILREIWIDPPSPYDNMMSENFGQWWSDRDGDILAMLRAGGWSNA